MSPRYIVIDDIKLQVNGIVYIWSAIDADSGELLAIKASYRRRAL